MFSSAIPPFDDWADTHQNGLLMASVATVVTDAFRKKSDYKPRKNSEDICGDRTRHKPGGYILVRENKTAKYILHLIHREGERVYCISEVIPPSTVGQLVIYYDVLYIIIVFSFSPSSLLPILYLKNCAQNYLSLFGTHYWYVIDDSYMFKKPEFTCLIHSYFIFAFSSSPYFICQEWLMVSVIPVLCSFQVCCQCFECIWMAWIIIRYSHFVRLVDMPTLSIT
jgi:hypothetical protein